MGRGFSHARAKIACAFSARVWYAFHARKLSAAARNALINMSTAFSTSAKRTARAVVSWAIALWICKVFLQSLPYKFTQHPDTRHIFGTIGEWMRGWLGGAIGRGFAEYGAYVVGAFELLTSLVLLAPALLWVLAKMGAVSAYASRARLHRMGGLMAAFVMCGAVFFHVFTPLGIVVLHQGAPDGGALFIAAVSIVILGAALFFINPRSAA